jgi:azurin
MTSLRLIGACIFLLATGAAYADPCKITIESNDMMRFNLREMTVPAQCGEVQVILKHSGHLPAKVMGHDWVLARDSDMPAIVNAGLAAGPQRGFLPENDKRIIAATKLVGGGETAAVTFNTSALRKGVRYAFFCTSPGHSAVMRGTLVLAQRQRNTEGALTVGNTSPPP